MKKLYFFLGLLVLLFTSCKKEYIPSGNNNQTILIPMQPDYWNSYDYGVTYSVSLNVPEITNYFNETGQVLVYISYGNGIFEQVPEVYGNTSYSFTHSAGNVSIYVQDLNQRSMLPPDIEKVKIVLVHSNY